MRVLFRNVASWPRTTDGEPAALLEARDSSLADNLSLAVRRHGVDALVSSGGDGSPDAVYAPIEPVFDDLLALWFLTDDTQSVGDAVAESLCAYAKLCRQGLPPQGVPVDESPRNVAEEILRRFGDIDAAAEASAYLDRCFELFRHLATRVGAGDDVLGPRLFAGSTTFMEEISILRRDHDVYIEDRARGEAWIATITQGTATRELPLLIMEEPLSNRFSDWARADGDAPNGRGYPLLLVRWPTGPWILTSDPTLRVPLGHLAQALQDEENARTGEATPRDADGAWYDGSRHRGTLVSSPRRGTVLGRDDIVAVLQRELELRPVESAGPAMSDAAATPAALRMIPAIAASTVVVIGLIVWVVIQWASGNGGGSTGDSWSQPRATNLRGLELVAPSGAEETADFLLYRRSHALIIGIDEYADLGIPTLDYAVNDARGIADVLRRRYGFTDETLTILENSQATKTGILDAFGAVKQRAGSDDSLFVFWAGHGTAESVAGGEESFGYLVPHDGTMENAQALRKNITMRALRDDFLASVAAKHKFVVLDACFGGLVAQTRAGSSISKRDIPYLESISAKNVSYFLTAGGSDQEVLDGGYRGHSVFAGHLIKILEDVEDYATASEIAPDIRREVATLAREHGHHQTPLFGPIRGEGDFVFVPRD